MPKRLCIVLFVPLACCIDPDLQAAPRTMQPAIANFSVESQIGVVASLDRAPRRPRLILEVPRGLELDEGPLALLRGSADSALLDDLERAPFSAVDRDRMMAIALGGTRRRLEVVPEGVLDADAVYTLVVGGWARDADGELLWPERQGFAAELRVGASSDAGASVTGFWPADASAGVPTNLALAVVQLDGALEVGASDLSGARIEDAHGNHVSADVRSAACADFDFPGHTCLALEPASALEPEVDYFIVIDAELRDVTGAALGPRRSHFRTAAEPDGEAPVWGIRPCQPEAVALPVGCALADDSSIALEIAVNEPAQVVLVPAEGAPMAALALDRSARFRLEGLAADQALDATLVARDAAGQESVAELSLRTTEPLPTLAISEVRADPLGPEPEQEYVELWNFGGEPIDLLGYQLTDDPLAEGSVVAESVVVYPGARALLVAAGFDAKDARDVPPPSGTPLARMTGALGRSGLSNSGEGLLLRDPQGRRVSAAPARPEPAPGACSVRVSRSLRDGSEGSFALDAEGTCSPGQ